MEQKPYILSFTAAGLSASESIKIAEAYLSLKDWPAVKTKVEEDNLLQARTQSSAKRMYRELSPRLEQLSDPQLALLVEGDLPEQQQLLWLAVCKRYRFIREFAVEVIREKFLRLDFALTEFDYRAFFNRKADWRPELDQLTGTTQVKIRRRIFHMAQSAGLLNDEHTILPVILSPRIVRALAIDAPMSFEIFPTPSLNLPEP